MLSKFWVVTVLTVEKGNKYASIEEEYIKVTECSGCSENKIRISKVRILNIVNNLSLIFGIEIKWKGYEL